MSGYQKYSVHVSYELPTDLFAFIFLKILFLEVQ